jgi:hypothetical protein
LIERKINELPKLSVPYRFRKWDSVFPIWIGPFETKMLRIFPQGPFA